MTEYDFSPEGYQRHLANMQSISRWVDQTEHHRSQFANAAALTTRESTERAGFGRQQPPPPPLNLRPSGHTYPYPSPPQSVSSSSSEDFMYASGPLSPGPMPTSMYRPSPTPAYRPTTSPPHTSPHISPSRSPVSPHRQGFPTYPMPPSLPYVQYPAMTPGYAIVSPGRRSSGYKRSKAHVY